MTILWTLFEIGINLFQGWMYAFFLNRQLEVKHRHSKKTVRRYTIGVILFVTAFYSLYMVWDIPVTDTVVFGGTFLYSMLVFSDPWYIKLFWNIILGVVMVALASMVSQIYINMAGVSWDMLMQPSLLRVSFVLIANMAMFTVYYAITKLKASRKYLSWMALLLFVLLNCIILTALEMQYNLSWQENVPQEPVLITIFCLLFVSAGLLAIFELLSSKAEKQAKLELKLETARMMEAHLTEVRSIYQRMMEYQHDMKHQINTLQQMFESGKIAEGKAYLQKFSKMALPERYATGCVAMDALLSAKSAYMRQQQIKFKFTPYPLDELPVDAPVFCSIVGNILDNAIEGIRRIPNKTKVYEVHLKFSRTQDMFFIDCKNEIGGVKIRRRGEEFLSAKRESQIGYGINSVRRNVIQAEGHASFRVDVDRDVFIVAIALPFMEKTYGAA